MKINLTLLKRFDKELSKIESKFTSKLENKYDKFGSEARKQIKGFQSGYRKNINLTGKTVKTNLRKELRGQLETYFTDIEKKSFSSVKRDLRGVAKTKEQQIKVANISAKKSREGNKAWAKKLADKQVKDFEDNINNALKSAKKMNPSITDKELKQIVDDKLQAFKNTRLNATIKNEANRIQNQIRVESFKESGLVQGVVFIAVLDNRTTANCMNKNGTKLKIDDPRMSDYLIPQHPNCRSMLSPILITDKNIKYTSDRKIDKEIKNNLTTKVKGQPRGFKYYEVA
jgi:SPP1 gp7 family putative phage head morphogenesis protein